MLKKIKMLKPKKEKGREKGKMIVFRRKQIAAASLVILIGIAGYLNWSFEEDYTDESISVMQVETSKKLGEAQMVTKTEEVPSSEPKDISTSSDYFAQAKIDREVKRDEAVEMLTNVLNSTESTEEAKVNAQTEIFTLAEKQPYSFPPLVKVMYVFSPSIRKEKAVLTSPVLRSVKVIIFPIFPM